jgi:ABC-type transport system involved in multi-copper enzyme maturation permease subunit
VRSTSAFAVVTFKGGIRDRLLQGLVLVGFLLIVSAGVFSSFSMRQPLEVAVNYSLSVIHILAIILTLFFGLNLISRELESRENHFILSQPISRASYILGKYSGFLLNISVIVVLLGFFSIMGLVLMMAGQKGPVALPLLPYVSALAGIFLSCSILGAIIVLFTSVATSSIFPFLLSCAVYAVGESTQTVKRYIASGMVGKDFPPAFKVLTDIIYYIFPNFSLFDFKAYAIYGLPFSGKLFLISVAYGVSYAALCVFVTVVLFERRDIS